MAARSRLPPPIRSAIRRSSRRALLTATMAYSETASSRHRHSLRQWLMLEIGPCAVVCIVEEWKRFHDPAGAGRCECSGSELKPCEFGIKAALAHQFGVRTLRDHAAGVHDDDSVGFL